MSKRDRIVVLSWNLSDKGGVIHHPVEARVGVGGSLRLEGIFTSFRISWDDGRTEDIVRPITLEVRVVGVES